MSPRTPPTLLSVPNAAYQSLTRRATAAGASWQLLSNSDCTRLIVPSRPDGESFSPLDRAHGLEGPWLRSRGRVLADRGCIRGTRRLRAGRTGHVVVGILRGL